jgi:dGTPase
MQVLDGILCHNGEADDVRIAPERCPDWEGFDEKVADNERDIRNGPPITLEGCVVKFADTIAYIGRDLQDAREIGLLPASMPIPDECRQVLGDTNASIIDTLIHDLLENSDSTDTGFISYSPGVEHALITLRAFSREQIYDNPKLTQEREKIRSMYRTLFTTFLSDIENRRQDSRIFTEFIDMPWLSPPYKETSAAAGLVRDYIAGMTDRYFARRFAEITIPRRIEGKFT